MKIIGITGPTGAGKTTALRAVTDLGGCVIDCDQVYHQLLEESAPMRNELTERFGSGILDSEQRLDRKKLGALVFQDKALLTDLNTITHRCPPAGGGAAPHSSGGGAASGCRGCHRPH